MDRRKFAKLLTGSVFEASILESLKGAALSPAEQQALAERLWQGDESAASQLFKSCVRLLPEIPPRYVSGAENFDDMIGAAIEGVVDALESCKQAGGVIGGGSFPDYVRDCIIRSIKSDMEHKHKFTKYIRGLAGSGGDESSAPWPPASHNLSGEQIRLLSDILGVQNTSSEIEDESYVDDFVSEGTPEDQDSRRGDEQQEERGRHFAALLAIVPNEAEYEKKAKNLAGLSHEFRQRIAVELAEPFNAHVQKMPHDTYEAKKEVARWVNAEVERFGLAVKCPKTGLPAKFRAQTGNWPGIGRFSFEVYIDGKRTTPSVSDKLPELQLIDATPSQEPEMSHQDRVGPKASRTGRKLT